MAHLLVRDLDDGVMTKLKCRDRHHGRSTTEEVREILRDAVCGEAGPRGPLGSRIAGRFASIGLEEDIPELREHEGEPLLDFDEVEEDLKRSGRP